MQSPQEKINEFFWELDKLLGANHPFIVLHGPADTFRKYIEDVVLGVENVENLEDDNRQLRYKLDYLKEDMSVMENGINDAIKGLENIATDKDSIEEIKEEIDRIITELDFLV